MSRVWNFVALSALLLSTTGLGPLDEELLDAVRLSNAQQVKTLIEKGADVNSLDEDGLTPLHQAIMTGDNAAMVELLLDRGANIGVLGGRLGLTPLHMAALLGRVSVIELLLKKSVDVNILRKTRDTPLHLAAGMGHTAAVKLLLKHGAIVNVTDEYGQTPLHAAAHGGHAGVAELLLEKGADVKALDKGLKTPLDEAVIYNHMPVAELLLNKGAPIEIFDKNGGTPFHRAVRHGNAAMVELLLNHGADVMVLDKFKSTSLHEAASMGNTAVMKLLLKKGAAVDARDSTGRTPLYSAVDGSHAKAAELLLANGAYVDARDNTGSTPLHLAVIGRKAMVRLLLDQGADIGVREHHGITPLHMAVLGGDLDIVQLLLQRDAYVGVKSDDGHTPLDFARNSGKASMVRLLEKAEAAQMASAKASSAPSRVPSLSSPPPSISVPRSDVDQILPLNVKPKPRAFAVVIGIEQYRQGLPRADFAARDAQVTRDYLTKVMGYAEENVAVLINDRAAKADMEKYIEHWLPNHVEQDASVFVYFSGHGTPNTKTNDAYLVPYDGDPAFVEATGYPLKRLYEHLAKLPAKEVVVMLDSCFSGAGGRSVIAKGTRPMALSVENPVLAGGKTVVLAASSGGQVSSTYLQQGHGLLTYFFLKGLQGEADKNKDGTIDLAEIFSYVKPQVERTARRDFNNEQTPQLLGSPDLLARGVRLVEVGP